VQRVSSITWDVHAGHRGYEKPVVLIVGENALVRSAAAERLRAAGFEVIEVDTSAEADCVLRTTLVDALIQITSAT
jgi:hypothetical protein